VLELTLNLGRTGERPSLSLELDYEGRRRSRQRASLSDGTPVMLKLPRGAPPRDGDVLGDEGGVRALVRARPERVMVARAKTLQEMVPAAYHLGNRHAQLEIGDLYFKFLPDPVLEGMLRGMGFGIEERDAPFEPVEGPFAHRHGAD
jgi:urease accessory protein